MPRAITTATAARLRNLSGLLGEISDAVPELDFQLGRARRRLHEAACLVSLAAQEIEGVSAAREKIVEEAEPVIGFDFKEAHKILADLPRRKRTVPSA